MMYSGTIETWPGTISEASSSTNAMSRPGKRRRANPYPDSNASSVGAVAYQAARMALLRSISPNGASPKIADILSRPRWRGIGRSVACSYSLIVEKPASSP